jgi:hypothetical protein
MMGVHDRHIFYLNGPLIKLRELAQSTIRFLDLFRETPELLKAHPLGICGNDECREIFAKAKPGRKFCSDRCREQFWRKNKLKSDPNYYSRNAKDARKAKKKMKKASIRRKVRE